MTIRRDISVKKIVPNFPFFFYYCQEITSRECNKYWGVREEPISASWGKFWASRRLQKWDGNKCVVDRAWGQDGWILAEFFPSFFMKRDDVEVYKNAKKERGHNFENRLLTLLTNAKVFVSS